MAARCYEERVLPLQFVVLLAGIQGLSEALPVSRSGHDAVAWIWLDPGPAGMHLENFLHLATASALLVASRRRVIAAAGAGLLAITRPALFHTSAPARDARFFLMALGMSMFSSGIIEHFYGSWKNTPVAMGFGMVLTGMLLATTSIMKTRPAQEVGNDELPLFFPILLGLAHGMAILPGGSYIAVSLVVSTWMGMKSDFALDLAMFLAAFSLLERCLHAALFEVVLPDIPAATLILALVTAFLGTTLAIQATRVLLEKRNLAWTAWWMVPLGLAMLAYSRASSEGLSLISSN